MKTYDMLYAIAEQLEAPHEFTAGKVRDLTFDIIQTRLPESTGPEDQMSWLFENMEQTKEYSKSLEGKILTTINEQMKHNRLQNLLTKTASKLEKKDKGYDRQDTWNVDWWILTTLPKEIKNYTEEEEDKLPRNQLFKTKHTKLADLSLAANMLGLKKTLRDEDWYDVKSEMTEKTLNMIETGKNHIIETVGYHNKNNDTYLKNWSTKTSALLTLLATEGNTWASDVVETPEEWENLLKTTAKQYDNYVENNNVENLKKALITTLTHIDHLWW